VTMPWVKRDQIGSGIAPRTAHFPDTLWLNLIAFHSRRMVTRRMRALYRLLKIWFAVKAA